MMDSGRFVWLCGVLAVLAPGSASCGPAATTATAPVRAGPATDLATGPAAASPAQAHPASDGQGSESARARLAALIRSHYQPPGERGEVVVSFPRPAIDLPAGSAIDIESGNGHGFSLRFVRITLHPDHAAIEDVAWRSRGWTPAASSSRRARASLAALAPLSDAVRVLPGIALAEAGKEPAFTEHVNPDGTINITGHGSAWSSSHDFFVLVRVIGPDQSTRFEREFAGYEDSSAELEYLPLVAVEAVASEVLDAMTGWQDTPAAELRATHFIDAFNRNRDLMVRDFHWWVMEYSIDALGTFGSDEVLTTLRQLRDRTGKSERRRGKIDAILGDPGRYLTGPAIAVPEP